MVDRKLKLKSIIKAKDLWEEFFLIWEMGKRNYKPI